ncbi:MAG TPA: hypothetical protein PLX85_09605, partial [Dehalococcoidia bacterium]|nr:hypothetical protein [Dehalococcoidia bacterium]
ATGVAGYPARLLTSTTSGLTWTTVRDGGMACTIYGKFYGPTTATSSINRAVRATVTFEQRGGTAATSTTQLLNRPTAP